MSEKVASRNRSVLEAAVLLATERGFRNFSRSAVADRAGVSAGSVNNAFGTMDGLHDAVMVTAVERRLLPVVATGLAMRHPVALGAPAEVRESALASLAAA